MHFLMGLKRDIFAFFFTKKPYDTNAFAIKIDSLKDGI